MTGSKIKVTIYMCVAFQNFFRTITCAVYGWIWMKLGMVVPLIKKVCCAKLMTLSQRSKATFSLKSISQMDMMECLGGHRL